MFDFASAVLPDLGNTVYWTYFTLFVSFFFSLTTWLNHSFLRFIQINWTVYLKVFLLKSTYSNIFMFPHLEVKHIHSYTHMS